MGVNYQCTFDLDKCIKTLGLDERGRVQQAIDETFLTGVEPYVPFLEGNLIDSGIENTIIGSGEIVWNTPYAQYMWNGIVYEDPKLHCAGFKTENGWFSRKDVQKVPTDRSLEYKNGSLRGSHWAERYLQNGGLKEIEKKAREAAKI